jgi:hypothetical protein
MTDNFVQWAKSRGLTLADIYRLEKVITRHGHNFKDISDDRAIPEVKDQLGITPEEDNAVVVWLEDKQ